MDEKLSESDFENNRVKMIAEAKEKARQQISFNVHQLIATKQEDVATEDIADAIKAAHYIYTTRDDIKSEIWIYDDGIYKPNGESHIKEVIRTILTYNYTPQRANKVVAKIEVDTMIDSDKFFNQNYIDEMPVQNGILNIKTRELNKFNPEKIFFNKLPLIYNPDATCEVVQKFFLDILKEEDDVNVAFELFGYSLLKDHPIEKAFMFVGNGRNGKGKFISLLKTFLGAENCCSVPLNQLRSDSTGVCELFGKLANLAGDLNNTALKETGLFKEVTGRDMVGAKRKYLRDLFFVNYSKQIFACNELPRVYDFSTGFWSRWVLLEFPYQFIDKKEYDVLGENKGNTRLRDTEIIDKLTTEEQLSGLLNAALDGLDRVRKNKDISNSKGTAETKNFWIRNSDSFSAYCLDMIEDDYEGCISKKELRSSFMKYCKMHHIKGASDKGMKVVLEDMFGAIEGRKWDGNSQEYVWEGIKFKDKLKISQISDEIPKVIEKKIPYVFAKDTVNLTNLEDSNDFIRKLEQKIRNTQEYKKWRDEVDLKYTKCNSCGDEWQPRQAHHIKKLVEIIKECNIKTLEDALKCDKIFNITNGESLCSICHRNKHGKSKEGPKNFTLEEIKKAGYTLEEWEELNKSTSNKA